MATIEQQSDSEPPRIVLTYDSSNLEIDTLAQNTTTAPLSRCITDMINDAFPAVEARDAGTDSFLNRGFDTEQSAPAELDNPRPPSVDSISLEDALRVANVPPQRALVQPHNNSEDSMSMPDPPPAYHFQPGQVACQASGGGRIITRLIAHRIAAQPSWSSLRNERPSARPFQSFTLITSISPSCTFSHFEKILLTPKLKAKVLETRTSGPRPGEIVKAWVYVQWRESGTRFLGFNLKGKPRSVDVSESNWATIVAALRDRTFVGELRVVFWTEVPLTEAQWREQESVRLMYRNTLRPYGIWR